MNWNELDVKPTQTSKYLHFKDEVEVKILSGAERYFKHFTTTISGKKVSIKCPGFEKCILCQKGVKIAKRYLTIVQDLSDGLVKIYDAPHSVALYLKGFYEQFKDFSKYVFKIKKNISGGLKTEYQVFPIPFTKTLTQQEIDYITNEVKAIDLKELAKPHTPEEIYSILNEVGKQPEVVPNAAIPEDIVNKKVSNITNMEMAYNIPVNPYTPGTDNVKSFVGNIPPVVPINQNIEPKTSTVVQPPISQPQNIGDAALNNIFNNFIK